MTDGSPSPQRTLPLPAAVVLCAAVYLTAVGYGLWAASLLSVLAGLGAVAVTASLAARLYGTRAGLFAGLVLATSPLFVRAGRAAGPDMRLTFLVVLCIALLRLAADQKNRGRRLRLLLFAYLAAGLAVAVNGPAGLVLPVGVMAAWLVWDGRPFALVSLLPLTGSLVAFALAAATVGFGGAFGPGSVARFFGGIGDGTRAGVGAESWDYLARVLPLGMIPWTLLLPAGVMAFWRFARRPAAPGRAAESTETCFPLIWAAFIVGLFSVAGGAGLLSWILLAAGLFILLAALWLMGRERYWKWIALVAFCGFALITGWDGVAVRDYLVLPACSALAILAGWTLDRVAAAGKDASPWARQLAGLIPAATVAVAVGAALVQVIFLN